MSGSAVSMRLTSADVKREAATLSFDLCGIARAEGFPELGFLRDWLDRGFGGEMHYLERTADKRADVRAVMPSAKSVTSLATVYNTSHPYSNERRDDSAALVARYAWGDDYHIVIERRLRRLVERLSGIAGEGFEARAYVDTGPIHERV